MIIFLLGILTGIGLTMITSSGKMYLEINDLDELKDPYSYYRKPSKNSCQKLYR